MYMKKCPECGEYSYSASRAGLWICATCGADISDVRIEVATDKERGNYNG